MKKVSKLRSLFSAKKGFIQHHFRDLKSGAGFTLIELLIVIAVLGVLAAVVLVAIDPAQQLARGRDAGRKTGIGQLGRAIQAYYTTQSAYPLIANWTAPTNILVSSGEIKTFPTMPIYAAGPTACTFNAVGGGYCYNTLLAAGVVTDLVIYARLESRSENNKCGANPAWFVFSAFDGRAGRVCSAADPTATGATQTFVD